MTTERIADQVKFAYWVPNVSGGLVTSFSLALLLATQKLKVIAAVHLGLWQPLVLAKLAATADHLSNGRFAVNVVSGWFKDESTHLGEPWLEHDERYRRSAEFLQVLRKVWTEDNVDFRGDFYRVHDFTLKPIPLNTPERPNPELFQGGNSSAARRNGGYYSDWYFSNGKDFDGVTEQIAERIVAYRKRGVDLILGGFLHFQAEVEYFGARVLPLVREIEAAEEHSIGEPVRVSA